eukprot:4342279-Amphidinium_carterae.1
MLHYEFHQAEGCMSSFSSAGTSSHFVLIYNFRNTEGDRTKTIWRHQCKLTGHRTREKGMLQSHQ